MNRLFYLRNWRIVGIVTALIFLAGIVLGIALISSKPAKAVASQTVSIRVGIWPLDNDEAGKKAWQKYEQNFKKKYPNIKLIPDPYSYSPETFLPKAESGDLPNIFYTWFTEPRKIIPAGYAADITTYAKKYGYDKAINPDVLKLLTYNGKIYGIPRDGYALGLYLNMNLFKKAGLVDKNGLPKYPKTWDELRKTAQIIKQKTGKAGFFMPSKDNVGGWHFTAIAWSFGAEFEKKVGNKWVQGLDSPGAVAALQFIKDLKWKYNVLLPNTLLSWGDWIKYYGTDQVGMVLAAPDVINLPVQDYKMSKDAIAIVPIPKGPKGQYTLMGGTAIMFSSNSTPAQIDACFKLLEVIGMSPKVNKETLNAIEISLKEKAAQGLPVGPRALPVWINKERVQAEDAIYKKYTNVNMALFKPYYDEAFKHLKPEEPYYTQDLYRILDGCIQQVLTNKNADPKKILQAAGREFQTKFLDKVKE
ncbi:extracellular solute-binding protein family 1 [Caldicellulosiruptor hydrothermalis 108]|uniref:Extracellular solute-binding protein family 1 n=1 Tax=Caldicellulosiruptor hydrothermalis (strain DSM 18901 / VKM B-2411 / 108) TaxID=632292 RepID=E4Q9F8_CALH1|nr:extracellular solute-binding protein [Caldicellulosiruptor hydrothermalis]ADQ05829.1 extracellular solute-binding protein family 1 [Caldicellulosiruptor hydrothermalis 108]